MKLLTTSLKIIILLCLVLDGVAMLTATPLGSLIRIQVTPSTSEWVFAGGISTAHLSPGNHDLEIRAQTTRGDILNQHIGFTVQNGSANRSGGGGSGSGGGDGGGSGSRSDGSKTQEKNNKEAKATRPEQPSKSHFIIGFQPEKGHVVSGSYSGIMADGTRKIVRLAHGAAMLQKTIKVPLGNYWFEMTAKDDRPGPVIVAIYINGFRWKTVSLDKNNDQYRAVRIGLLKNFSSGTIRFKFLNDTYDKRNPGYPPTDRNFDLAAWRLVSEK